MFDPITMPKCNGCDFDWNCPGKLACLLEHIEEKGLPPLPDLLPFAEGGDDLVWLVAWGHDVSDGLFMLACLTWEDGYFGWPLRAWLRETGKTFDETAPPLPLMEKCEAGDEGAQAVTLLVVDEANYDARHDASGEPPEDEIERFIDLLNAALRAPQGCQAGATPPLDP